jgi:hypothetical protein
MQQYLHARAAQSDKNDSDVTDPQEDGDSATMRASLEDDLS